MTTNYELAVGTNAGMTVNIGRDKAEGGVEAECFDDDLPGPDASAKAVARAGEAGE
jgi:hypothetical protein